MTANILHYFSQTNAQYLHAHGELGTKILIQKLDCQVNNKILEIGLGTGSTLMYLFSAYPKTEFYGVEQSEFMYQKAKQRYLFCGAANKITLKLMKQKNTLPFESHFFDKIYAESVLSIQENNDLEEMLKEIKRVLKPNGILVINETIWLDSIGIAEIKKLNLFCKQNFGIIQNNESYPHLADWLNLFELLGFKCESVDRLADKKDDFRIKFRFPYSFLSFLFTFQGKIKTFFSCSIRNQKKHYQQKMNEFHADKKLLMEGILMKFIL